MRLCFCNNHFTAKENNVKVTNQQENDTEKPSECKIAKTVEENDEEKPPAESIEVKVIYNKNKYDVSATSETTIAEFKEQLQALLGVPDSMQKLMYKGLLQDNHTFKTAGVTKGAKIMLVGSTLNDVLAVSSVSKQDVAEMEKASSSKEPLCKQKVHRKVLDKGLPEDVMPGILNLKV